VLLGQRIEGVVKMLRITGKAIVGKATGKTVSLNGLFLSKL
jgi:hypothetical protein